MTPDLDAPATAVCVSIDDVLLTRPEWAPECSAVGIVPKLSDAESVTLAVIGALLGYTGLHIQSPFPALSSYPSGVPGSCSVYPSGFQQAAEPQQRDDDYIT